MWIAEKDGTREYRLPRQQRPAPANPNAVSLRIAAATASCPSARSAVDGNPDARWVCGPQDAREWFLVDLGQPADGVSAVRYAMGESYREFPRALVVETSLDGETWDPARTGDVIAETIEGTLADPLMAPATLTFPPRRARYVRLRQTGKDEVNWALPELAVLAIG